MIPYFKVGHKATERYITSSELARLKNKINNNNKNTLKWEFEWMGGIYREMNNII